jgi:alpha-beta hydrolase superfamily lysophospholipase
MGAVALIDGSTGSAIASKVLARDQQGRPATLVRSAPMLIVAAELTRTKLADLGDARLADLRRWLIAVPDDSWAPTLRALLQDDPD